MTEQLLIDPVGLAAELTAPRPPVVLDIRWTLAGPQRDAYLAGHIPGALFVNLDADLAAPAGAGGRHPLPETEALQRLWRSFGISDDSSVVVYDDANSSIAARAWWLLRWSGHQDVRVLDGGYAGWRRAGLGSAVGEPAVDPAPGNAVVRPGGMPTVDIDGAAAASASVDRILLDARAPERYRGETEPIDPVAGHIPGAVNLPSTELVSGLGAFLPVHELTARFAAAGLRAADSTKPGSSEPVAIASCGSGVTACQLILAGRIAGLDLALYPGSYSGWCAAERPVATGS